MPQVARQARREPSSQVRSALRTLDAEGSGIAALAAALDGVLGERFADAVELLRGIRGRAIVTGMGKSGHIGRKVAATLASTGTPAFFVHPGEASHGDLGMITSEDAVIALSWSGETVELRDIINHARRFRVPLVAVTASETSALGRASDIVLVLPRAREACPHGLAPTTSTVMQLALGDALALALLESRGFTVGDFKNFHPGGKLGASLTFVRDLMHEGERLPLVGPDTAMSEVILEMSAKGFGCVGVVAADGRLAGILTDGDLRRNMGPGLLVRTADEVMTRTPITIEPDALASSALQILDSRKRSVLLVVEQERPVGILHIHDLLRARVV
jgi:arabinose-5-phosphate isomerase